jgi:predicted alpha-1,2-mannosidase
MRTNLFAAAVAGMLVWACAPTQSPEVARPLTSYVDPFIGTAPHGHTFPGATLPFGMVQLSLDNGRTGWDWSSGYNYEDSLFAAFSHKHLSGTGIGDLVDIAFTPTIKPLNVADTVSTHYTTYRHQNESAEPGYYQVRLDNGIDAEFTVTQRAGMHHYTFPQGSPAHLLIDLGFAINWDKATAASFTVHSPELITGYRYSTGWAKNQKVFFAIRFQSPIRSVQFFEDGREVEVPTGVRTKAFIEFETSEQYIKVGLSSASEEGALANLEAEMPGWDFESYRQQALDTWEKELQKIQIEADEATKRIFYTALYHSFISPNLYSDIDGKFKGQNGGVRQAEGFQRYSVFSLWDTFRALHPLLHLTQPELSANLVASMLDHYRERGALPVWELENHEAFTMVGNHSVAVIAEAFLKGIPMDTTLMWEALYATVMQDERGMKDYRERGFIPDSHNYSVSMAVEYAYDDWCVGRVAEVLGKPEEAAYFYQRSLNYRNHFNPATGFLQARKEDGAWAQPFNPLYSNHFNAPYVEANAWQYLFFQPHDNEGFVELLGGKQVYEARLDSMFTLDKPIEGEDASIDISGLIGQYAHGNEQSHHVAYLYNFTDHPRKGQKRGHQVLTTLYDDTPYGLAGNEDCGQMSAWYVWSALGMYPVNPADLRLHFGSPIVDKARVQLPNGKELAIVTQNRSQENIYIEAVFFNGTPLDAPYILYPRLLEGGELKFVMTSAQYP